jgi:hypothetical protein
MIREPYNADRYVTRLEEEPLWDWLNQTPHRDSRRLGTLVGTTGIGKSWLLAKIRDRADEAGNYLIFWADAPEVLANDIAFQNWLQQVVAQARQAGLTIDFHRSAQMSYLVRQIAAQCCGTSSTPARWPLLLVDQADMLPPEMLKTILERSLLQPFLQEWCTRAIITLRNERGLAHHYLKRKEWPLAVSTWSDDKGREQLRKRNSGLDLAQQTPGYEAVSPGVNSWFDNRFRQSGALNVNDLEECLRERTKDTAGEPLTTEAFEDLIHLSEQDGWTIEEFALRVRCSTSEAMSRLGVLTDRVILLGPGGRYSLPYDLRGLISAYLKRRAE